MLSDPTARVFLAARMFGFSDALDHTEDGWAAAGLKLQRRSAAKRGVAQADIDAATFRGIDAGCEAASAIATSNERTVST